MKKSDITSIKLAPEGKKRIAWADKDMSVLQLIRSEFSKKKPLKGLTLAACLHVTTETANLMRTLRAGGAEVHLCAANPLSTNDAVAASLVKDHGIHVYARRGENNKVYYQHMMQNLDAKPHITMDDGGDQIHLLHTKRKELLNHVIGSTEETTTGVVRLQAMEREGALQIPVVAVNESKTKHMFDNRYGTGQSTMDGIIRATNVLLAGRVVVIAGYGWCGRGAAMRAAGLGARVIVTEVDAFKGLEAVMDGFEVKTMEQAAPEGDVFVTLTGNKHVIRGEHFKRMKDGAIVCNSGHFDIELNLKELKKLSKSKKLVRDFVEEFTLRGGRNIRVIGEGRLVNLVAADGHPASVMDMSFANQALAAEFIAKNHNRMKAAVHVLPEKLDRRIAELKLRSMKVGIDKLTPEQVKYMNTWKEGT